MTKGGGKPLCDTEHGALIAEFQTAMGEVNTPTRSSTIPDGVTTSQATGPASITPNRTGVVQVDTAMIGLDPPAPTSQGKGATAAPLRQEQIQMQSTMAPMLQQCRLSATRHR